ncbi:MAG: hypothetical protein ACM3IL_04395 [Deltaproteobacteria bacterium]
MKTPILILLSLTVTACCMNLSFAQEPAQTPAEAPVQELHAEKKMLSADQVVEGTLGYIEQVSARNKGYFPLYDPREAKSLRLTLLRINKETASYLNKENAYSACADFMAEDSKVTYDIDLWMRPDKKGKLKIYKTVIHKRNDKPRFTYSAEDKVALN